MKKYLSVLAVAVMAMMTSTSFASDTEDLTGMLNQFLAGASINDAAVHDRFWAEDLVYTSSRGLRFGKAEIMEGMSSDDDQADAEPAVVYSAEDVRIKIYGDTAVVAFRLLGTPGVDTENVLQYLNTGTFVKRKGEWRVVAWQATVIPVPE